MDDTSVSDAAQAGAVNAEEAAELEALRELAAEVREMNSLLAGITAQSSGLNDKMRLVERKLVSIFSPEPAHHCVPHPQPSRHQGAVHTPLQTSLFDLKKASKRR